MTRREKPAAESVGTPEIEAAFTRIFTQLHSKVTLDGIDWLEDHERFRIRSRDEYGRLPDIVLRCTGDRRRILERIAAESRMLHSLNGMRQEIRQFFPQHDFLEPMRRSGIALVGIVGGEFSSIGVGRSFLEAYQSLRDKLIGSL